MKHAGCLHFEKFLGQLIFLMTELWRLIMIPADDSHFTTCHFNANVTSCFYTFLQLRSQSLSVWYYWPVYLIKCLCGCVSATPPLQNGWEAVKKGKVYENERQISYTSAHKHTSPPPPGQEGHLHSKAKKGLSVYFTLGIKLEFKWLPLTRGHICSVTNFSPLLYHLVAPPSLTTPGKSTATICMDTESRGMGLPSDENDLFTQTSGGIYFSLALFLPLQNPLTLYLYELTTSTLVISCGSLQFFWGGFLPLWVLFRCNGSSFSGYTEKASNGNIYPRTQSSKIISVDL